MKKILLLVFILASMAVVAQKKNPIKLADSSVVEKVIMVNYEGKFTSDALTPYAYTTFDADESVYKEGAVITTGGYSYVTLYYSKTASTADNLYFKVIGLTSAAGTNDYQQTSQGAAVSGVSTIESNVYEVDKAGIKQYITIPTGGLKWMRIDCAKTAEAGTASTVTTLISKKP